MKSTTRRVATRTASLEMRNRDGLGSSLTNGTELLCRQLEPSIVNAAGSESDAAYGNENGRRNDAGLGRDRIISQERYSWSRWPTARSCAFGSSNYRPLTRRTTHLHFTRLTRFVFKSGAYNRPTDRNWLKSLCWLKDQAQC